MAAKRTKGGTPSRRSSPRAAARRQTTRFTQRLRNWGNHPIPVALLLFAAVVSALLVVANAGINVVRYVDEELMWKGEEYAKLEGLRAGFSIDAFDDALGTAVFVRQVGQLREQTYRGRDYWVQAVSGPDGVVRMYSVLSCDVGFNPTFRIPGIRDNGQSSAPVTLQDTRADFVLEEPNQARLNVLLARATANGRFLNILQGGNPGFYKKFAWGWTDGCVEDYPPDIADQVLSPRYAVKDLIYRGPGDKAPPGTRELNSFRVNTYAEMAPQTRVRPERSVGFQVGPDRILLRTTSPPSVGRRTMRETTSRFAEQYPKLTTFLRWFVPSGGPSLRSDPP